MHLYRYIWTCLYIVRHWFSQWWIQDEVDNSTSQGGAHRASLLPEDDIRQVDRVLQCGEGEHTTSSPSGCIFNSSICWPDTVVTQLWSLHLVKPFSATLYTLLYITASIDFSGENTMSAWCKFRLFKKCLSLESGILS